VTTIGLRIDVDTYRGTRDGVPRLLDILARHDIKATFFFSVGPDNMGRHLRRLLKPSFAVKMLRSRAASLYGWDILLAGTLWPGRRIAARLGPILREAADAGHEVGLHAWDHHRWQTRAGRMSVAELRDELARGVEALEHATGRLPTCSAAAGWICNEHVLEAKEQLGFVYNSDCRGLSAFRPVHRGHRFAPQVPTTLPTYDEMIGRDGVDSANYNQRLLAHARADALNVLAVHAEVEGIVCSALFDAFLGLCRDRELSMVPLRDIVEAGALPGDDWIAQRPVAGREGAVCWQRSALAR
jgi:undecaprenyl phosphate-alpha-L-ara4FN deformylase